MVNRIIKKPLEEGSSTLPSILKINQGAHFLVTTINGDAIEDGKVYNASALNGAIGNNYNEFTIDFFSDNVETMTDGVKRLYLSVTNDIFITLRKDIEIERTFKIFKIDDLSYQAMTMNNYDFFVKVFKIVDKRLVDDDDEAGYGYEHGEDEDFEQFEEICVIPETEIQNETEVTVNKNYVVTYKKISSNSIALIKAYTSKEAWLLVDKTNTDEIDAANDKFKLVIDFTYKFFKDENSNKLRFPEVNKFSNVQDLFNKTEVSSPYYDRYYFKTGKKENMAFLNKQSEYISRSVTELFALTGTTKQFTLNTVPRVTVKALRMDNEPLDLTVFKQKTIFADTSMKEITPYLESLSYEVYGYEEKNSLFGVRCFKTPELGVYKRFEVYPILPGVVHYMFKITSESDKIVLGDLSDLNIRKCLKDKHIYLYNYFDLVYNTFIDDGDMYLDIYTYVPYEYEASVPSTSEVGENATSFALNDIFTGNNHSGDYRSRFDITRTYENTYTMYSNLNGSITEDEYYLPYFGNDVYVKTIIDDVYATDDLNTTDGNHLVIPQVFSNDIDLLELKNGEVLNKYFDILSWQGGTNVFQTRQEENTIDADSLVNQFNNLGFRTGFDEHFGATNIITNYENENLVLCENLAELLPDSIPVISKTAASVVDISDCLFAYIETNNDHSKYLNVTLIYNYGGREVKVYQSYKTYDMINGSKFIIPADPEYLKKIKCDKNMYNIYCMK